MVRELRENEIWQFIDFGDGLYRGDENYTPYLRKDLRKAVEKLVFVRKTYKALCAFDESGRMVGRMLLTVGKSKQLKSEHCGYFSHFEVVNDPQVFRNLMSAAEELWRQMGAEYALGSFFPHDPDDRRGILIQGFELPPMIFTSHNPPYYQQLFESYGFLKLTDAYEYEYREDPAALQKIKETAERAVRENDISISRLNLSDPERDIDDVHTIMQIASSQINFEEVLSRDAIKKIFTAWKSYVDPDFALIARRNSDGLPIGFTLSVPDYNELIRKMKGRTDLRGILIFLLQRKKLTGLRAILQYIIPEYQHKGVSKALYNETRKAVEAHGIRRISLGTIMEQNGSSNGAIASLGGHLSRVYRIYYKSL